MIPPITFRVDGFPKPAGSKRGFVIGKRAIIVDDCKGSRDWKTDVSLAAKRHYLGALLEVPIKVRFTFHVLRPKGHFRSGTKKELLKDSAPLYPTTRPDVLKLARGVEDALTGIIWKDDSLIVHETIAKRYGTHPGVEIEISEMTV